jgi:leukotriene-A4 hydrolase
MATIINPPRDPNTLSNYNNWLSTHITANFEILFDQKKLAGNVVHRLKSITDGQSRDILLDTSHLAIDGVKVDGKSSKWELLAPLEPFGTALRIQLDQGVKLHEVVEVDVCLYRSSSLPVDSVNLT